MQTEPNFPSFFVAHRHLPLTQLSQTPNPIGIPAGFVIYAHLNGLPCLASAPDAEGRIPHVSEWRLNCA